MEVIAKARYLRIAPRKVRLVVGFVRGMDVAPALAQLKFMSKAAALPVAKLIRSAVANAEHNFKLDVERLYIKKITADNGPVLKRWRARAFGRAASIRKRLTHVSVTLDERPAASPKGARAALVKQEAGSGKPEEKAKKGASVGGKKVEAAKKAAAPAAKKAAKKE
jgi:large subunit ribosomal protein L22